MFKEPLLDDGEESHDEAEEEAIEANDAIDKSAKANPGEANKENVAEKSPKSPKSVSPRALQRLMDHNKVGSRDHAPATVKIATGHPGADLQGQNPDPQGQSGSQCECCKCSLCPFKGQGPIQLSLHMRAVHDKRAVITAAKPWYDGTVYECGLWEAIK